MKVSIIREDDDLLAGVRISLGSPRGSEDFYLVFRGDPKKVIELLEKALPIAKKDLRAGNYDDHRRIN
jgi:hypothetical protein